MDKFGKEVQSRLVFRVPWCLLGEITNYGLFGSYKPAALAEMEARGIKPSAKVIQALADNPISAKHKLQCLCARYDPNSPVVKENPLLDAWLNKFMDCLRKVEKLAALFAKERIHDQTVAWGKAASQVASEIRLKELEEKITVSAAQREELIFNRYFSDNWDSIFVSKDERCPVFYIEDPVCGWEQKGKPDDALKKTVFYQKLEEYNRKSRSKHRYYNLHQIYTANGKELEWRQLKPLIRGGTIVSPAISLRFVGRDLAGNLKGKMHLVCKLEDNMIVWDKGYSAINMVPQAEVAIEGAPDVELPEIAGEELMYLEGDQNNLVELDHAMNKGFSEINSKAAAGGQRPKALPGSSSSSSSSSYRQNLERVD